MTITQIIFLALVYTGVGTILIGIVNLFYWIKEKIQQNKELDEEDIDLITQRVKIEVMKALQQIETINVNGTEYKITVKEDSK